MGLLIQFQPHFPLFWGLEMAKFPFFLGPALSFSLWEQREQAEGEGIHRRFWVSNSEFPNFGLFPLQKSQSWAEGMFPNLQKSGIGAIPRFWGAPGVVPSPFPQLPGSAPARCAPLVQMLQNHSHTFNPGNFHLKKQHHGRWNLYYNRISAPFLLAGRNPRQEKFPMWIFGTRSGILVILGDPSQLGIFIWFFKSIVFRDNCFSPRWSGTKAWFHFLSLTHQNSARTHRNDFKKPGFWSRTRDKLSRECKSGDLGCLGFHHPSESRPGLRKSGILAGAAAGERSEFLLNSIKSVIPGFGADVSL